MGERPSSANPFRCFTLTVVSSGVVRTRRRLSQPPVPQGPLTRWDVDESPSVTVIPGALSDHADRPSSTSPGRRFEVKSMSSGKTVDQDGRRTSSMSGVLGYATREGTPRCAAPRNEAWNVKRITPMMQQSGGKQRNARLLGGHFVLEYDSTVPPDSQIPCLHGVYG
jgi:hypothetical protein